MHLLEQYMIEERSTIMDNNLRVRMIGRREGIPEQVLRERPDLGDVTTLADSTAPALAVAYAVDATRIFVFSPTR